MKLPNQVCRLALLFLAALYFSGCAAPQQASVDKVRVTATTTLVGDVVRAVGGDHISLSILIPANIDEHTYQPTAREVASLSEADLIFMNGAGLERFIDDMIKNAGGKARLVSVSDGIQLLEGPAHTDNKDSTNPTDVHLQESGDPHVWTDPNNVLIWVDNIEKALIEIDAVNADDYRENAAAYRRQLIDLDRWVQEQVTQIPLEHRNLVTDHTVFTYFADRYGFTQIGAIVPGYSTASAPSAQELTELEDSIRKLQVPVIFVGNTVNQKLAAQIAQDTNTRLIQIQTGSLTHPDGPAPTYLEYIRFNVNAIIGALK